MPDGHIRFERVTELKTKTLESVENVRTPFLPLGSTFLAEVTLSVLAVAIESVHTI